MVHVPSTPSRRRATHGLAVDVLIALQLLAVGVVLPAARAAGFPNVVQPEAGLLLSGLNAPTQGRTAIIAYHNGLLYTVPESASSFSVTDDIQVRSWDISDPAHPVVVESLGTSRHPISAHGYFNDGPRLVLGDNIPGAPWTFVPTDVPGLNVREFWSDQPGGTDGGVGDRGRLYHPFHINSWWSYGPVSGNAVLSRVGGAFNANQPLASWDHLALTGVIGHPFIVGNLLIIASDQTRTGIATYDISNPAEPVLLDLLKTGGPGGYWPELWGGNGQLYVVWPYNNGGRGFRVVDVTDPADLRWVIDRALPGDEPMYAQFQDEFAFIANHKIDMRTFETVLSLPSASVTRTSDGGTGVDTSQFALPLGNLLVTGGSGPLQGMSIWTHQTQPDERGPEVGFHIPRSGQTQYPIGLPITLLIHETLDSRTLVNRTNFIVRPLGGDPLDGHLIFAFDDTLTFTPHAPLEPATTYEVVLPAGGLRDAAGNPTTGYAFTFSTGSTVGGNAPPVVASLAASLPLADPGVFIDFTAVAVDPDPALGLEYRFDAGDGRPKTGWSESPVASFAYAEPGHYRVTVQVRDAAGAMGSGTVNVTVYTPPSGPGPSRGTSIALDATRRAWLVNPDNDSVAVLHADTRALLLEIPVGADPRSVALDAAGQAWVTCHDADRIDVLASDGTPVAQIPTGYGSGPFSVAFEASGQTAYVTLYGSGRLLRLDAATRAVTGSLDLGPTPRALAVRSDGTRIFVSRFLSPANAAEIWEVQAASPAAPLALARTLRLPKFGGIEHADGTADGRGTLNQLAGLSLSPDEASLWVVGNKPNVERGALFGANLDHDNSVRNAAARLDLAAGEVDRIMDLDNSDSASALAFSPRGDHLLITLQGNDELLVFDALSLEGSSGFGSLLTRVPTGPAPQGLVTDPVTGHVLVQDFLGRTITEIEAAPLFAGAEVVPATNRFATLAVDALPANVSEGKRIFYRAADPRMSSDGYQSCATCHLDGGSDGRVWDFTQRGEGLRNTTELRGRAGLGHGRVHWSANFDEIQDFEHDIRGGFGGTGFLPGAVGEPLGVPKAGASLELDQLAAYVSSLGTASLPRSPFRAADGAHTPDGLLGRAYFQALDCAACHSGAALTDSAGGQLHDVGTLRTTSGFRLGATLTGIDTPTLRGIWANAPYFHDGSAPTLESVFETAGGVVIQAESGTVTGGTLELPAGGNVAVNWDNTVHGGLALLQPGGRVTLASVEGGPAGGLGAVEFRYSGNGGVASVRVNGIPHAAAVPATGNVPAWRTTAWGVARVDAVLLGPGSTNVVEIVADSGLLAVDHLTVSTAQQLALAEPHRVVRRLVPEDRAALLAFLRELDGSPTEAGTVGAPTARLALAPGQAAPLDGSHIDVDCTFGEPVTGLVAADFLVTGTAGGSPVSLVELVPGLSYRLRLGSFAASGNVQIRLPAATVLAVDDATPSLVSPALALEYLAPAAADPLVLLGDEFDTSATASDWQLLHEVEGWNASKLEAWDIDGTTPDHLRFLPTTGTWYQDRIGPAFFKSVTGDFVVTVRLDVGRRNGQPGRPSSDFSLAGILVRAPRAVSAAAPVPDPGPGIVLPVPAPGFGQPDHYVTDWTPGGENYLRFTFGTAWPASHPDPAQWQYHVSDSRNSGSDVYWDALGVPTGAGDVTLQIARVGATFLLLRRHSGGPWLVEQRVVRNDLPATLQVGVAASTDYSAVAALDAFHHNRTLPPGNPDLVVEADYFRLSTPPAGLTAGLLAGLPLTRAQGAPVALAATAAGAFLGDHAAPEPAEPSVPPVAAPDAVTLHHGGKARIAVLENDAGNPSPATVEIVTAPAYGTATPLPDGTIRYAHVSGTPATDVFSYRVGNGSGISEPATVTVTFAAGLRIPTPGLALPATPPPTAIQLAPAFGALAFNQPICVASPPGDTHRLFVVERAGTIRLVPDVTAALPASQVFLDLPALLATRGEFLPNHSQYGLVGLAFHPNHALNGRFFVFYSVSIGGVVHERLARFTTLPGDPDTADPGSEVVLIQQRDDIGDHLGGDLHFGPDGYLYVSVGDEGGQHDSSHNSQRIDGEFFSAILRLDVDKLPGNPEPNLHPSVPRDGGVARYSVPADNPFVTANPTVSFNGVELSAGSVRTEFWAVGFRNPWRFSFDPATGELWCGDVGQYAYEEINVVVGGGNYGWAFREAAHPGSRAGDAPTGFTSLDPLYEYAQGNGLYEGRSVTGGLVYRGTRFASLTGAYLFADWVSGNVWSLRRTAGPGGPGVDVQRLAGEGGITAFGTDPSNGDVLLVDYDGNRLLRLTVETPVDTFPATLSATGLFADLADLSPGPGVLPYEPNLRFWSDHADKRRWFVMPDVASRIGWARDDAWTFPAGMIWVKHFDLQLERGNPATARRIETRVLVKTADGSYGVSYHWNDAQTEATLVPDGGLDLVLDVLEGGIPIQQSYRIPSRGQCLVCHTPQAGHALSFNTRQLHRDGQFAHLGGNQIRLLHEAGYFSNDPESPALLPRFVRPDETQFPLATRVRSYLAVNCMNCHRAGGTAPPTWDARPELTMAQTGIVNGHANNDGGDPANRLVVPGDPAHSVILGRLAAANGFTRMPPVGSSLPDPDGIALLTQWIQESLPATAGNVPPTAAPDQVSRALGRTLKIPVAALVGNDVDPDGPAPLALLEAGPWSANGARVRRLGDFVVYEGEAGDAPDAFGYTLSDGAETAMGFVNILVSDTAAGPTRNIVATTIVEGQRRFTIAGIPGRTYQLQRAEALEGPWTSLPGAEARAMAGSNGACVLVDALPGSGIPAVFYRAVPVAAP